MAQSVDRGLTQSVDRPLGVVDRYGILGESELVSEFISDLISEVLIFFSSWVLCLYIEGCCTLLCDLERGNLY